MYQGTPGLMRVPIIPIVLESLHRVSQIRQEKQTLEVKVSKTSTFVRISVSVCM
jgi:hypothetical protein